MRDIGEQKVAAQRAIDLEREVTSLQARHQTSLELLGEKSELVEEMQADINDLKSMYRELVEQAVKH